MSVASIFIFVEGGNLLLPPDYPLSGVRDGLDRDLALRVLPPQVKFGTARDPQAPFKEFSFTFYPPGLELPKGWALQNIRPLLGDYSYDRILRAYHLAQWEAESRFCGSCGCENTFAKPEAEAASVSAALYARLCPRCGRKEFPRISPAIIVLIKNPGGEVLLAHNVNFREKIYSLIAGFVEAGENLENAVHREVREEVGIEVSNVRYITSQGWPFPNSLMLGFHADYASGEITCDGEEIADARWFTRDAPPPPPPGSVSRLLIDRWLEYR